MRNLEDKKSCTRMCWAMGIVAGILLALVLMAFVGWGFFISLLLGLLMAGACCFMFTWMLCSDLDKADTHSVSHREPTQPEAAGAAMAATSMAAGAGSAVGAPVPQVAPAAQPDDNSDDDASGVAAVADTPRSMTAPASDSEARPDAPEGAPADADTSTQAQPKPTQAAEEKITQPAAAENTAPPQARTAPAEVTDTAPAPSTSGDTPQILTAARDGVADDLKLISGVGPKLEQTLNELGIFHFDQIANWGATDIAWVDERLRFKGRIERDDWPSQARILAKGEETGFSARKRKN